MLPCVTDKPSESADLATLFPCIRACVNVAKISKSHVPLPLQDVQMATHMDDYVNTYEPVP
jgi:hypothetical protein